LNISVSDNPAKPASTVIATWCCC